MLYDLVVIGGGINGCGCAADAALRGLSVLLCEQDDLAAHTSSASSKLIHGGIRYLEQYQFNLVRNALKEQHKVCKEEFYQLTCLDFNLEELVAYKHLEPYLTQWCHQEKIFNLTD